LLEEINLIKDYLGGMGRTKKYLKFTAPF